MPFVRQRVEIWKSWPEKGQKTLNVVTKAVLLDGFLVYDDIELRPFY